MFPHIAEAVYVFLFALVVAILEINIEGRYGWAEKTATWYRVQGPWAWLTQHTIWPGKPLTGYHLAVAATTILFFHYPYFAAGGKEWSVANEIITIAIYLPFAAIWDNLWFVNNPFYGLRYFRPRQVWWFADEPWLFGRIPMSYINAFIGSWVLAAVAGLWEGDLGGTLINHAVFFATIFVLYILTVAFFAPAFSRWHKERLDPMKDERHLANIFHWEKPGTEDLDQNDELCYRQNETNGSTIF